MQKGIICNDLCSNRKKKRYNIKIQNGKLTLCDRAEWENVFP